MYLFRVLSTVWNFLKSSKPACLFGGLALLLTLTVQAQAEAQKTIVIMPKLVGISYYDVVKQGVDKAAKELPDINVIWTGPTQDKVEKQIKILEDLIPSKPAVIAVAANNPVAIVPVLKKAQKAGIHVMSWDGDANFREFFVNLVNFNDFGSSAVEALSEEVPNGGNIAIITTSFSAPNQSSWIKSIKQNIYAKKLDLRIIDIQPAGESMEEAYRIAKDLLQNNPDLKGIVALGVPNVPGVARAVKEAGLSGKVAVVGNSTPNLMRTYLKDGTAKKVLLWNAPDHGYLTVYSAYHLLNKNLKVNQPFAAGDLGSFTPIKDKQNMQVALPVLIFTKDNVDAYDF